jgi:uncharacterized protein YndB with AHSA1/START domain
MSEATMQLDGQLERIGDRGRLTFTRSLKHAPEKVWRALTETDQLAEWFPDGPPRGKFVEGETVQFGVSDDREGFEGTVVTVDPPRLLEYTWGGDTLRFELQPDGDGTVLTFTDTFDEYGKAARDGAGWHACLDMLGHALDGTRPAGDNGSNWREVYAGYIERLGPEASTIGPPEGHG